MARHYLLEITATAGRCSLSCQSPAAAAVAGPRVKSSQTLDGTLMVFGCVAAAVLTCFFNPPCQVFLYVGRHYVPCWALKIPSDGQITHNKSLQAVSHSVCVVISIFLFKPTKQGVSLNL